MIDPERIWLQNADDARATGDRLWCQDKVWPECAEQQDPTEYIRADLYASRISQQDAERERVRRELEEAKEDADEWRSIDRGNAETISGLRIKLAEARRAAFIEAAEIAEQTIVPNSSGAALGANLRAERIAGALRAKAEETGR